MGAADADSGNAHRIQRCGWIPDLPNARDRLHAAPMAVMAVLPPQADLRPQCPPLYDQGQLGSCTADAIAAALQFDRIKENLTPNYVLRASSSITTSA
jgi:hypothetical protein